MGNDLAKNAIAIGLARRFVTRKDRKMKNQYLQAQIDSLKADAKAAERKILLQDFGMKLFGQGQEDPLNDFTGGGAVTPAPTQAPTPATQTPTPAPAGGPVPLPQAIAQSQRNQYQIDPNALMKGEVQAMTMQTKPEGDYAVSRDPFGRETGREPIQRSRPETEYREGGILHVNPNSRQPVAQTLTPKHWEETDAKGNTDMITAYEPVIPGVPISNIAEVMQEVNSGRAIWMGPPMPGIRSQSTAGKRRIGSGATDTVVSNPDKFINDEGQSLSAVARAAGFDINEITYGDAKKFGFHEVGERDKPAPGINVDEDGNVVMGATVGDVLQGTVRPADSSAVARNKVIDKNELRTYKNELGLSPPLGTTVGEASKAGYKPYNSDVMADGDQLKNEIVPALYDLYRMGMEIISEEGTGNKLIDTAYFATVMRTGVPKKVFAKVKAYNDLLDAVTGKFARSVGGEKGVLSQQDRLYAKQFFLIIGGASQDTMESANAKMQNIVTYLNGKTSNQQMPWLKLRTFEEMKRLGWTGAGDYAFTDRDGITHEVTAKNASDYNRYLNLAEYVGVAGMN